MESPSSTLVPEVEGFDIIESMTQTADSDEAAAAAEWVSPVFGDIAAKIKLAANLEIKRRLELGLPVVVERGNGIEELTA
jgi:hypothetical protein